MICRLLTTDAVAEINSTRPGDLPGPFPGPVNVPTEDIRDAVFDIVDVKGVGGSIKRAPHSGTATYINQNRYLLRFIRYEEYLNQFRLNFELDWSKGMSRPDFIVYTPENNSHFIVHELSEGSIKSKRKKAVLQILNTLRFFHRIPSIRVFIDTFRSRQCFISADGCPEVSSPMGMADGFMAVYASLPDPLPIHNQSIERMGFLAYETNVADIK